MFPPGCASVNQAPQEYGFIIYDSKWQQIQTHPYFIKCNGGATLMSNLAAGTYSLRVFNF